MRKEEGLLSRGVTERSQVRKESNREETEGVYTEVVEVEVSKWKWKWVSGSGSAGQWK